MLARTRKFALCLSASVLGSLFACGEAAPANEYVNEKFPANHGGDGGTSGSITSGGSGNPVTTPPVESCAESSVAGQTAPVHLVTLVDTSESMCLVPGTFPNCGFALSRWGQAKAALGGFFSDAASKDAFASLIPWSGPSCNGFDTPIVPEIALPDVGSVLSTALNSVHPNGATPTHGAINGAVRYGLKLKGTLTDGGRVVIVLVTDGEPTGCSNLPLATAAAAAAKAAGFPVYVIGLGNQVANLKKLAASGGTTDAFYVNPVSPANVSTQLQAALQTIKGAALGCTFKLPTAPAGKSLDYGKVNVSFKAGGSEQTIPYSADCASPTGWRYDVAPAAGTPSSIELCSSSCNTVKAAQSGEIKYVLGCETKTVVAK